MSQIDFTQLITAKEQGLARDKIKRVAALDFLKETDWMVIRAIETGIPVADDMVKARAKARLIIEK